MKKKKYKRYYMHTIEGRPASYVLNEQICYIGKLHIPQDLATSLRQIRIEQRKTIAWRNEQNFDVCEKEYDYIIVHVKE